MRQISADGEIFAIFFCTYGTTILGSNVLSLGNAFQIAVTHIKVHFTNRFTLLERVLGVDPLVLGVLAWTLFWRLPSAD